MKLSVSLTDEDIELLDTLVSARGLPSRSAGVRAALALARDNGLEAAYEQEWREWSGSAEADLWESTATSGEFDRIRPRVRMAFGRSEVGR